jgi:uncharacterized damage-inducible protein DinB
MEDNMDRRHFLGTSGRFAWGLTGAASLLTFGSAQESGAPDKGEPGPNVIGPRAPYSPQIGTLISMLTWMRRVILNPVEGLTVAQLDYLHDEKANTIGALLLHLAAIERYYQLHTFEGKKWGDWDDAIKKRWDAAADLGEAARKTIKGNQLGYYLDALKEVRQHTLAELSKRNDAWLMQVIPNSGSEPMNNYCAWFHVCEHESNHNGQVKWLKARLPG